MNSGFLVGLLNPVISGFAALLLLVIWLHHRTLRYVLLFAGACGIGFVAFSIRDFGVRYGVIEPAVGRFVVNLLFVGMALLISAVVHIHYRRVFPVRLFALLYAVEVGLFTWSLMVEDDLVRRTVIIHLAIILIVVFTFVRVQPALRRTAVDFAVVFGMAMVAIILSLPVMLVRRLGNTDLFWTMTMVSTVLLVVLLVVIFLIVLAAELLRSVRSEASLDVLSRLPNRRGFEQEVREMIGTTGPVPLGMVLMDIDHFKTVNDSYGHAVGDEVIRACGGLLNAVASPRVRVGRVGGEEFALCVAAEGVAGAAALAEDLRRRLAEAAVSVRVPELRITGSFGVAPADVGDDLTAMLAHADEALYQAKRSGRNRVCVLEQPMPRTPDMAVPLRRRLFRDRPD